MALFYHQGENMKTLHEITWLALTAMALTVVTPALAITPEPEPEEPVCGFTLTECPPEDSGKRNNGWGNGDQAAPGGSFPNNNAENNSGSATNFPPAVTGKGPFAPD